MRRNVLFFLLLAICPGLAWSKCVHRSCYAITFETKSCSREIDFNQTYSHALLKGQPARIREVQCSPGAPLLLEGKSIPSEIANATEYHYSTYSNGVCASFQGRAVTLFMYPKCCDTFPPSGECLVKSEALRDLPPWAQ